MDFMATVLEVLGVERPATQSKWAFDGVSVLPILRGEAPEPRGIGWMYMTPTASVKDGYAFRYGKWKLAVGGISCDANRSTFNCSKPQLYDMQSDWAENHNLALKEPVILAAIERNFSIWHASVLQSMKDESKCSGHGGGGGGGGNVPFPKNPKPSSECTYKPGFAQNGADMAHGTVATKEECCGACAVTKGCHAGDFASASARHPTWDGEMTGGTCHLKSANSPKPGSPAQTAIVLPSSGGS